MRKKKLVFKKSGAERRLEKLETTINYTQVTGKSFDGGRLSMALQDEVGLWATPSDEAIREHAKLVELSKRAVTFNIGDNKLMFKKIKE